MSARTETNKKLEAIEKHVDKMYDKTRVKIEVEWNAYMKRQEKVLTPLYNDMQKAKKTGIGVKEATEKYKTAYEKATLKSAEYRKLVDKTTGQITKTNEEATEYINKQLAQIYAINYNELTVDGLERKFVNTKTVQNLANNNRAFLPYKQLDKYKDALWNEKTLNAQVLQSIMLGESPYELAKRLKHVVGMNNTSAIRNARTMVTGAENKGKYDSFKEARKKGVKLMKMWLSAHDGHTRHAHLELDGVELPIDEPFENSLGELMYPADPDGDPANVYNCRCSLVSVVKGFDWE